MSASPTQGSPIAPVSGETPFERDRRIFESLPPLRSPAYLSLLKSATAAELPATVLVRAYRQLYPSPAADATLDRLLGHNARYGYITILHRQARRRMPRLDAYGLEDLVCDAIGEIFLTLAGKRGEIAERMWFKYLGQCMEEAHRKLVGRRGERLRPRADTTPEERDRDDPIGTIPWHGCVAPSKLEWLEGFLERTAAAIPTEPLRAIARDLLSHDPLPVANKDPRDPKTLVGRFNLARSTIYELKRAARAILFAALQRQRECEIDISFLTFSV
jgi:hypothetical protein